MSYLYHITYYRDLGSIDENGLRPGSGRGIGSAVYDMNRQGMIFFSDAGGISFWAARAEEWGENRSDDVHGDGLVPVLLRVDEDKVLGCEDDEEGSRDSRHDAFRCGTIVEPEDLEVWVGFDDEGAWRPLEDWGDIPYEDAFDWDEADDDEDEEGGGEQWAVLKGGGNGSPLVPHVAEENPRRRRARRPRAQPKRKRSAKKASKAATSSPRTSKSRRTARRRIGEVARTEVILGAIDAVSNPFRSPPAGFLEGAIFKDIFYHGTNARVTTGHGLSPAKGGEYGIYLTPSHQYARRYGANLVKALVAIRNPIVVKDKGEISPRDLTRSDIMKLRRAGYDGIVVEGAPGEIVAFEGRQVWVTDVV